jgi:NADPH:quinone reductase-like Zn-dependent oxidoreductase
MRTMELPKFGLENLSLVKREQPAPGPGQILVRVRAAAVNYRDFLITQGFYNPNLPLPLVPLSDGAGEVAAVGEGVSRFKPGDRVSSVFWQSWQDGPPSLQKISASTGCEAPGMLTEYALLPESAAVAIPGTLSFAEAAALPCAGVTAWRALTVLAGVKAGDTVLVLGTGGVSMLALQFAKALGCKVIVTSSSDEKLERARALGADHGINYRNDPEWGKTAFGLAGLGVQAVIETGGAGTLVQSIGALGWDGHIAYLGSLAGMSAEMNLLGLVAKNAHLHGLTVGSRADHEAMLAFVERHGIKPVVETAWNLEQGADALKAITAGQHFGKLIIGIG